jgi:hypothetical protein
MRLTGCEIFWGRSWMYAIAGVDQHIEYACFQVNGQWCGTFSLWIKIDQQYAMTD